jgi:DNA-binding NarL/FixJ family response regulator
MLRGNLSSAEQRVLNLVSQAKTNKEIAATLHISPATVKRHLEDIFRKLHLKNRVEAAIYGLIMTRCSCGVDPQCPLELWRHIVLKENR